MRSRPKSSTKHFISLIIEIVDPPVPTGRHPIMSPDLEKALGAIQRGAEEHLEVLRNQIKNFEAGESSDMKPVLGHLEFVDEGDGVKSEKQEPETGELGEPPCK